MEFVASFENTTRKIRTTVRVWGPPCMYKERDRINTSKMRLLVMRRDGYRCRSCGRTGDEITLEVHCIRPAAAEMGEMLALCAHCGNLVNQWCITANSDFEFLDHLQRQARAPSKNFFIAP